MENMTQVLRKMKDLNKIDDNMRNTLRQLHQLVPSQAVSHRAQLHAQRLCLNKLFVL